jgi:sugar diacid utilization regulator
MAASGLTGADEIGRENVALRRLVLAYQHLTSLAVHDANLETVTELIAERMDTAVAVVDDKLAVLASAGRSVPDAAPYLLSRLSHPRLAQVLGVVGPTRRALRIPGDTDAAPIIVAPVPVGPAVPAYLLTLDDDERDDDEGLRLLLTEHAATICGVILGRERVVAAAATQARYDLVEGLLSGRGIDPSEVRRWAAHLGYDEQREYRVVSLLLRSTPDTANHMSRLSAAVERFFTTQVPEAITAMRDQEVVVVVPEQNPNCPDAMTLAELCIGRMREAFHDAAVTAGVSRMCRSALEIAPAYDNARRAVDIVMRMGRAGTAVGVDDLGIHRLLLQVADPVQLHEFAREVFGPVLTRTKGNEMEYLCTLACYFRVNNSPQRAAKELHVHPNTVNYRIRRIEELAKLDLRNYRDRLMAQVALEILDMIDVTTGSL